MPTILSSPPKDVPECEPLVIGTIDDWEYYVSGDSKVVRRRDIKTNRIDEIEYRPSSTAFTSDPFESYSRTLRNPLFGNQETGLPESRTAYGLYVRDRPFSGVG